MLKEKAKVKERKVDNWKKNCGEEEQTKWIKMMTKFQLRYCWRRKEKAVGGRPGKTNEWKLKKMK